jgi:hypothetical protein
VVTISASYGAAGTVVGPRVAELLGLPYLERVMTPRVARGSRLGVETVADDERPERLFHRLAAALAGLPLVVGGTPPQPVEGLSTEEQVRNDVETSIQTLARTTGGVVLGRGGMVVLRERPGVFHVRLHGSKEARVRQAMRIEAIDEAEAVRRLQETDRARALYLRRFYHCDADDLGLYHLVLDSTTVPLDTCADLIVAAASAAWE